MYVSDKVVSRLDIIYIHLWENLFKLAVCNLTNTQVSKISRPEVFWEKVPWNITENLQETTNHEVIYTNQVGG